MSKMAVDGRMMHIVLLDMVLALDIKLAVQILNMSRMAQGLIVETRNPTLHVLNFVLLKKKHMALLRCLVATMKKIGLVVVGRVFMLHRLFFVPSH